MEFTCSTATSTTSILTNAAAVRPKVFLAAALKKLELEALNNPSTHDISTRREEHVAIKQNQLIHWIEKLRVHKISLRCHFKRNIGVGASSYPTHTPVDHRTWAAQTSRFPFNIGGVK